MSIILILIIKIHNNSFVDGEELPNLGIPEGRPETEIVVSLSEFIGSVGGMRNFRLGIDDSSIELRRRLGVRERTGNITFLPILRSGEYGKEQIVLNRWGTGGLKYNVSRDSEAAVEQFKLLINKIIAEAKSMEEFPVVDINPEFRNLDGLTSAENRELSGALNPSGSMDPRSRTGEGGALQLLANGFQEKIDETSGILSGERNKQLNERLTDLKYAKDRVTDRRKYEERERLIGITEARDMVVEQRTVEEVREQQEEDVNRFKRIKEWVRENAVGLSAIVITVAGIVTTILVGARTAVVKGSQAVGRLSNTLKKLWKKFGAILGPILSMMATALSMGSKGLSWVANNLWVIVVAFVLWFSNRRET